MTSIPSDLRALATRCPPEISPGSTALLSGKVASGAGVVVALTWGSLLLGPGPRRSRDDREWVDVNRGGRPCARHGRPGSVRGLGPGARRARCRGPRALR